MRAPRKDTRPRRQHRASESHPVVDGYRGCALASCGKILPDEALDRQMYCSGGKCAEKAQRERRQEREFMKGARTVDAGSLSTVFDRKHTRIKGCSSD